MNAPGPGPSDVGGTNIESEIYTARLYEGNRGWFHAEVVIAEGFRRIQSELTASREENADLAVAFEEERLLHSQARAENKRLREDLEAERRLLSGLTGSADSLRSVIEAHDIHVESCDRTDDDDCIDRSLESLKYWLDITKPHLRAAIASQEGGNDQAQPPVG